MQHSLFVKEMTILKIEKLKSGSYRIRKMYKGTTYSVVTDYKPTQKEAIQLLAAEMDKIQGKKQHMSFQKAAEEYIEIKSNIISPSTIKGYQSVLRNISDDFKHQNISDITALEVQKEINQYSSGHSAKTVRNMHGFISAIMGMYAPNTILNTTLPQYIKKEPYIPTDANIKAIMEEAQGTAYEIPLMLAVFGLRLSEICALTVSDFSNNSVTINKALVLSPDKTWVIKQTKTATSTRTIYIPSQLIDKIKKQGYVYKGYPGCITKFLVRTENKLGLPHFTIHKLRHYYASLSHSLGIPDTYIMKSGGWKTDNVMKNVYRHALSDKQVNTEKITGEYIQKMIL